MSDWWTLGVDRKTWERQHGKPLTIVALVAWFAVLGLLALVVPPLLAVAIAVVGYLVWARFIAWMSG
jgi:hypothetical protein